VELSPFRWDRLRPQAASNSVATEKNTQSKEQSYFDVLEMSHHVLFAKYHFCPLFESKTVRERFGKAIINWVKGKE
jgi:hypothetical protein